MAQFLKMGKSDDAYCYLDSQIEVNSFKFVLCNSYCEDTKDGRQSLGAADTQLIDGVHHLLFPGPELHTASSKECPQMMDGSMIQNKCICSLW